MLKSLLVAAPFAAAAVAGVVLAAPASAQPNCVNTGQTSFGGSTTVCQSPGNAQITTSPGYVPGAATYLYPYGDYYYGPALVAWP